MGVEKLDQRSQAERTDQGAQPQQPAQQKDVYKRQDFSWSNSAKSYEGLYNEVVNLW